MFGTKGNTFKAFVVVFLGCVAGIIVGWEMGAILGKVTGAIEGLEWTEVLLFASIMAILYGILPSLAVGILYGGFVFIYLKKGGKQAIDEIVK